MYCSGIVTLEAMHVSSVTPTRAGPLLTYFVIALMITASCPVPSMIPPNIIAIIVIRIENAMPISPPFVRSASSASMPEKKLKPFIEELIISPNITPLCSSSPSELKIGTFVAIISGVLHTEKRDFPIDLLGLDVCPNMRSKAVLHYDTEQSEYQLHKNIGKTLRRASLTSVPDFYHPIFLAALSRKERLQLIKDSIDLYHHRYGGIHLVVIDGIADLIRSANDESESIAIVDELYRLAGIYNTCIICVLHFVPNGIKLRGHIGSELQRKSAAILSIEKDENPALSVVKALKVRDGSPLDVPLMLFGWDREKEMHVYRGEKSPEDKEKRKLTELGQIAKEVFHAQEHLSYNELVERIMQTVDVKDRTAKSYISYMRNNGIIEQQTNNLYNLKL